jgi:hypothetical protein
MMTPAVGTVALNAENAADSALTASAPPPT